MAFSEDELRSDGYSTGVGHGAMMDAAERLGLVEASGVLKPRQESASSSGSLSEVHGLGAFPWHTDGAVSMRPPRWLVMEAIEIEGSTSTEILSPSATTLHALSTATLRTRDATGRVRYLPAVVPDGGRQRLRWDARSCPPTDETLVAYVDALSPTAAINWEPETFVIFDNHRLLHRRPAVQHSGGRVLARYYVWENR